MLPLAHTYAGRNSDWFPDSYGSAGARVIAHVLGPACLARVRARPHALHAYRLRTCTPSVCAWQDLDTLERCPRPCKNEQM